MKIALEELINSETLKLIMWAGAPCFMGYSLAKDNAKAKLGTPEELQDSISKEIKFSWKVRYAATMAASALFAVLIAPTALAFCGYVAISAAGYPAAYKLIYDHYLKKGRSPEE